MNNKCMGREIFLLACIKREINEFYLFNITCILSIHNLSIFSNGKLHSYNIDYIHFYKFSTVPF